jgi:hypothetical protein
LQGPGRVNRKGSPRLRLGDTALDPLPDPSYKQSTEQGGTALLTQLEIARLQQAYGSRFIRKLQSARIELQDAIEELDCAIGEVKGLIEEDTDDRPAA